MYGTVYYNDEENLPHNKHIMIAPLERGDQRKKDSGDWCEMPWSIPLLPPLTY